MRVLVVGLGSIGRRHVKNLKSTAQNLEIAVLRQKSKDTDLGDLKSFVDRIFFDSEEALLWKPAVTLITNPAPFHISTALMFAQAASHVFIEKPLADSTKDIELLLQICESRKLVLMVGYVLRFLKPFQIIKKAIDHGKIGKVLSVQATVGEIK